MRALWSLVVVCLVAAGGVGRADARAAQAAAIAQRAPLSARTPGIAAIRNSRHASVRSRATDRELSPATLAAAPSLPPPSTYAVSLPRLASDQVARRPILTCSARGPPI